jgi:hypothetical protein
MHLRDGRPGATTSLGRTRRHDALREACVTVQGRYHDPLSGVQRTHMPLGKARVTGIRRRVRVTRHAMRDRRQFLSTFDPVLRNVVANGFSPLVTTGPSLSNMPSTFSFSASILGQACSDQVMRFGVGLAGLQGRGSDQQRQTLCPFRRRHRKSAAQAWVAQSPNVAIGVPVSVA